MNDHKHVTCIIQNANKTRWVIAGIHADNGYGKAKWELVNKDMVNLALKYNLPTIVYLDINTDVEHQTYKKWKRNMTERGWIILQTNSWTRKGAGEK